MFTRFPDKHTQSVIRYVSIICGVIGIAVLLLPILFKQDRNFLIFGWLFIYCCTMGLSIAANAATIDEEKGEIYDWEHRRKPLKISEIRCIAYRETKKGRYRYLTIHTTGPDFLRFGYFRATADKLVAQLLEMNPGIEVTHSNYW